MHWWTTSYNGLLNQKAVVRWRKFKTDDCRTQLTSHYKPLPLPPLFAGSLVSRYSLHRADYPPGFLHFFPLSRAKHQTADLESCSKSCPADIVLIPNPVTDDDDNPDESHKLKHICQAIKLFLYTTGVVRAASHSCGYFPLNSSSFKFQCIYGYSLLFIVLFFLFEY